MMGVDLLADDIVPDELYEQKILAEKDASEVEAAAAKITSLSISGPSILYLTTCREYVYKYTCTAIYSDGTTMNIVPTWSSSGFAPFWGISISSDGKVIDATLREYKEASITITATYKENGVTISAKKDVKLLQGAHTLSDISISGNSSVNVGSTATYTCTAVYDDGITQKVNPTWSISSGNNYATINSSGVLTGKAAGTVSVQANYGAMKVNKSVTIKDTDPYPVSISISGNSSVNVDSSATYTCKATYSDGSTKTVTPTWSVTPTTYASITSNGVLTGKSAGVVTIKASYTEGGVTKTVTKSVTIINVNLPDLVASTGSYNVTWEIGGTDSILLTILNNGSVSAGASYINLYLSSPTKSSSDKVADLGKYAVGAIAANSSTTVNCSFNVPSSLSPGDSYYLHVMLDCNDAISESNEDNDYYFGDPITLQKTTATLSSISITGNSSVILGSTATYTCKATYSDGSTKTITPTWSISSGTSYASITSGGVLTGKSAGTAIVKASYIEGGVTKTATMSVTITIPDPNPNGTAVRSVSRSGKSATVTLKITPKSGVSVIFVEEKVPSGVTVKVNDGGTYTASRNMIRWSFLDGNAREISYVLTVANSFEGKVSLSGEVTFDESTTAITGTNEIDFSTVTHPADMDDDWEIITREISSYALAWTKAQSWSREPVDIPVAYVSRAALIWVNGGYYTYDSSKNEPSCWVSSSVKPASVELAASSSNTRKVSVSGNKANVTLTVKPGSGISVYFVEERIPTGLGLNVSNISNNGTYVANRGLIRWSFLDGVPRTLTYTLEASSTYNGTVNVDGDVTFDETTQTTNGDRQAVFGNVPMLSGKVSDSTMTMTFTGTLQESTDMKSWRNVSTKSPYSVSTRNGRKYYRSVK